MPHYHWRKEVSLLSSGRDQVVHSRYGRQRNCDGVLFVLPEVFFSITPVQHYQIRLLLHNRLVIESYLVLNQVCVLVEVSFTTHPTVWVLYSQASRAISIG